MQTRFCLTYFNMFRHTKKVLKRTVVSIIMKERIKMKSLKKKLEQRTNGQFEENHCLEEKRIEIKNIENK